MNLISQWSLSIYWENNDIVKIFQFFFHNSLAKSDITWMQTRISCNQHFSFNHLCENLVLACGHGTLHEDLILFQHFKWVNNLWKNVNQIWKQQEKQNTKEWLYKPPKVLQNGQLVCEKIFEYEQFLHKIVFQSWS